MLLISFIIRPILLVFSIIHQITLMQVEAYISHSSEKCYSSQPSTNIMETIIREIKNKTSCISTNWRWVLYSWVYGWKWLKLMVEGMLRFCVKHSRRLMEATSYSVGTAGKWSGKSTQQSQLNDSVWFSINTLYDAYFTSELAHPVYYNRDKSHDQSTDLPRTGIQDTGCAAEDRWEGGLQCVHPWEPGLPEIGLPEIGLEGMGQPPPRPKVRNPWVPSRRRGKDQGWHDCLVWPYGQGGVRACIHALSKRWPQWGRGQMPSHL